MARQPRESIPLADVLADVGALSAASGLGDADVGSTAHLDGLAVPADHRETVVLREGGTLTCRQHGLLFTQLVVRAAAGVVVHLIDLGGAAKQAVGIPLIDEGAVNRPEV